MVTLAEGRKVALGLFLALVGDETRYVHFMKTRQGVHLWSIFFLYVYFNKIDSNQYSYT